jgi:hypothetical protein
MIRIWAFPVEQARPRPNTFYCVLAALRFPKMAFGRLPARTPRVLNDLAEGLCFGFRQKA